MPFDIGWPELIVLVMLAVIIFGPDKLPGLARKAARVVRYVQNIANDARGQLAEQLGPEFSDLKDLNPRTLGRDLLGPDATGALTETRETLAGVGVAATQARQSVQSALTDAANEEREHPPLSPLAEVTAATQSVEAGDVVDAEYTVDPPAHVPRTTPAPFDDEAT